MSLTNLKICFQDGDQNGCSLSCLICGRIKYDIWANLSQMPLKTTQADVSSKIFTHMKAVKACVSLCMCADRPSLFADKYQNLVHWLICHRILS